MSRSPGQLGRNERPLPAGGSLHGVFGGGVNPGKSLVEYRLLPHGYTCRV